MGRGPGKRTDLVTVLPGAHVPPLRAPRLRRGDMAKAKKKKALSDGELYAMLGDYIDRSNELKRVRADIVKSKAWEKDVQVKMDSLARQLRSASNRGPTGKRSFVLRGDTNPVVVELTARTVRVVGAVDAERLKH